MQDEEQSALLKKINKEINKSTEVFHCDFTEQTVVKWFCFSFSAFISVSAVMKACFDL